MKRSELLSTKENWITRIQLEVYDMLETYRVEKGMNKTELANHLSFSKGYISQILNGEFNYKISTLVDLSLAVGKVPIIKFVDLTQYIENDSLGVYKVEPQDSDINFTISYDNCSSSVPAYELV